jgi:hypothetical protein
LKLLELKEAHRGPGFSWIPATGARSQELKQRIQLFVSFPVLDSLVGNPVIARIDFFN